MGAKFYINDLNRNIWVYDTIVDMNNDTNRQYIGQGVIYSAELHPVNYTTAIIKYHHATRGFIVGYAHCSSEWTAFASLEPMYEIYTPTYGYYENTGIAGAGYKFSVRRDCYIYGGTSIMDMAKPGDAVLTDGYNDAGATYGDRLSIKGVRLGGVWYPVTDGWVGTGLREGFETQAGMTIYSSKWAF